MSTNDVSVLSEDASLAGRISGQDLTVLGGFEGEINVRGRLRIGPNAKVNAKVKAESVELEGQFEGEIRTKTLTVAPSARARGLFLADRLAIREGAVVEGAFNLAVESDARPDAKPEAATVAPVVGDAEATMMVPPPAAESAQAAQSA
jgi:cytoskeletal protein CcmA (bactofilin family)